MPGSASREDAELGVAEDLLRHFQSPSSQQDVTQARRLRIRRESCYVPMTYLPFAPLPPDLPPEEHAARLKRQHHVEWGVAVARSGGTEPSPALLRELQRYIDGDLSLAELAGLSQPSDPDTLVVEATLRREQFTR